jgi:hypothetical protein
MSKTNVVATRRRLLLGIPAGALFCLGCRNASIVPSEEAAQEPAEEKHKFLTDSGMTVEEVFQFAFTNNLIPLLKSLALEMDQDKFIEALKTASARNTEQMIATMTKDLPSRDFAAFTEFSKNIMEEFPYNKALTYEITEATDTTLEFKYTECLFAKTFRDADAADIGYAVLCSPSPMFARAFNENIKLSNPKNLLKGDEVCIERSVFEV